MQLYLLNNPFASRDKTFACIRRGVFFDRAFICMSQKNFSRNDLLQSIFYSSQSDPWEVYVYLSLTCMLPHYLVLITCFLATCLSCLYRISANAETFFIIFFSYRMMFALHFYHRICSTKRKVYRIFSKLCRDFFLLFLARSFFVHFPSKDFI